MRSFEQSHTLNVGDVTLTVVERTVIEQHRYENGFVLVARKTPDSVLIETTEGPPQRVRLPPS